MEQREYMLRNIQMLQNAMGVEPHKTSLLEDIAKDEPDLVNSVLETYQE